jgi:hypothetical protein
LSENVGVMKKVMEGNMEKVLDRSESLDILLEKSKHMDEISVGFKEDSKRVKNHVKL